MEVSKSTLINEAIADVAKEKVVAYSRDVLEMLKRKGVEDISENYLREKLREQIGNNGSFTIGRQSKGKLVITNNNYKLTDLNGYHFDGKWLENRAEEMRAGVIRKLDLEDVTTALFDEYGPEVLHEVEKYFRRDGLNVSYDSLENAFKLKSEFDFVHERVMKLLNNRYRNLFDEREKLKISGESKEKIEKKDRKATFLQYAISAERPEPIPPIWRLKRPLISKSTLSDREKDHFVGQIHYWLGKEGGKFTSEIENNLGKTFWEVRHGLEILACLPEEEKVIKQCPFKTIEPDYQCLNYKEQGPLLEMVDTSQTVRLLEFGEEYRGLAIEALRKSSSISIVEKEFKITLPNKEEIIVFPSDKKIKKDSDSIGFESAVKIINDSWKDYKRAFLL